MLIPPANTPIINAPHHAGSFISSSHLPRRLSTMAVRRLASMLLCTLAQRTADMNIVESTKAYEAWLRKQLRGDVIEKDLRKKYEKMAADSFQFLRATYWRWAETVETFCPDFDDVPKVLAVGDIYLENYGVWR